MHKPEHTMDNNMDFKDARNYANNFDPTNPVSVRNLQTQLNSIEGLTDGPLLVDGVFGDKTEAALRKLQNVIMTQQSQRFGFNEQPNMPSNLSTKDDEMDF